MYRLPEGTSLLRTVSVVWLLLTLGPCCRLQAQAPATQSGTSSPATSAPDAGKSTPTQAPASGGEVTSRDTPATFKVRVNLVLVRVVVRDSDGKAIANLKQEDFQLFDNRKAQSIVTFSMETPQTRVVKNVDTTPASGPPDAAAPAGPATPAAQANVSGVAQRFVAMVFDDINLSMEDSTFVRKSAERFLNKLAPSDRVAMFSTSGQVSRDFTNDREALEKALLGVIPRPLAQSRTTHNCPDISYYQADLMENKGDQQARALAAEDAVQCAFQGDETQIAAAQAMAESEALNTLAAGDADANMVYRHMEDYVRRLVSMPGERVMVLVSPGFIPSTLWSDISSLIDRATRAKVVINTIDARGLYTPDINGDIASPARDSFRTGGYKASYRVQAQSAQEEVLAALADGTGGTFFSQSQRHRRGHGTRRRFAGGFLRSGLLSAEPQDRWQLPHHQGLARQQAEIFAASPPRILRSESPQGPRRSRERRDSGSDFLARGNSRLAGGIADAILQEGCRRSAARGADAF